MTKNSIITNAGFLLIMAHNSHRCRTRLKGSFAEFAFEWTEFGNKVRSLKLGGDIMRYTLLVILVLGVACGPSGPPRNNAASVNLEGRWVAPFYAPYAPKCLDMFDHTVCEIMTVSKDSITKYKKYFTLLDHALAELTIISQSKYNLDTIEILEDSSDTVTKPVEMKVSMKKGTLKYTIIDDILTIDDEENGKAITRKYRKMKD